MNIIDYFLALLTLAFIAQPTIFSAPLSLSKAAHNTIILEATRKGEYIPVKKTLSAGGNPDIANAQGVTALMLASYHGYTTIAHLLLAHGATPNLSTKSNAEFNFGKLLSHKNSKTTALMLAAFAGKLDIVIALIKAGADVNMQDSDGQTALIYAILGDCYWPLKPLDMNRKKIIYALLEAGADARLADRNGLDAAYYYFQVAGLVPGFDGNYEIDEAVRAKDPLYKKMLI